MKAGMIRVRDLFESHLTVSDLSRSMAFYGDVLGLELAHVVPGPSRRVLLDRWTWKGHAWPMGSRGGSSKLTLHLAFRTDLADLLHEPAALHGPDAYTAGLARAFDQFEWWGNIRGLFQATAFAATLWALAALDPKPADPRM
jgi:catechol 2,3-dioxygenase-like lactoylglutathione lyase family enzyme